MHVPTDTATQAVIRARMDHIDLMTRVLGCESDVDRGRLFDMSSKTINRARSGYVGGAFVASVIASLRQHERALAARNLRVAFEELFEVVVIAKSDVDVTE